ncbi:MAG: radical SAM protein [Candidatus Omnitrophica bacterium]|nr:radical SAM protein [Candidatus Omnitrophota bacterium]
MKNTIKINTHKNIDWTILEHISWRSQKLYHRLLQYRLSKTITRVAGPLYCQNHDVVQMDISYCCDLKCIDCNRNCSQAPSGDSISVQQVEKFINESIEQNRKWSLLRVMGGEPTLHPRLYKIIEVLRDYKINFSPDTTIRLETNGFSPRTAEFISKMPPDILITNTMKTSRYQAHFAPINVAPIDLEECKYMDYTNSCIMKQTCGLGFTPYGFDICGTGGAIARVLGFNVCRKKLPNTNDMLTEQSKLLCKYCGFFWYTAGLKIKLQDRVSPTWKEAFEKYKKEKPALVLY